MVLKGTFDTCHNCKIFIYVGRQKVAGKNNQPSAAGLFLSFFLKATVIILGLVILAMGVFLIKQIISLKNTESEKASDEAVFEDDNQTDDLMMASSGDSDKLLYDGDGSVQDGSGTRELGFDASIVVLNATETEGLAGAWKEKLEAEGFSNIQCGNYTNGYLDTSKIVVTSENTGGNLQRYMPGATMETLPGDQVSCDV